MKFILATRGSKLALWQANTARAMLAAVHARWEIELLVITSAGDREQERDITELGTVGVFTVEVDQAVLTARAHAGVHSMKDMSTALPRGLALGGALARGPVEDVLVAREATTLAGLPRGAKVATGSVRRVAMLKRLRPDLEVVPVRGNVDTRIAKLARGDADALILARAGLERLSLAHHASEVFDTERFVPAVGQGIVGLTCRSDDQVALEALHAISDRHTAAEALAERAFLRALHGGCNAPIGGHARARENSLALHGRVLSLDGTECIEDRICGPIDDAEILGSRLAERLRERGASRLVEAARTR